MAHDFDNDPLYRNPTAWKKVKAAFGAQYQLPELFAQVERTIRERKAREGKIYCPRVFLAAALHHFLSLSPEEQYQASRRHGEWMQQASEKRKIDAEFYTVMEKIFGREGGEE